MQLTFKQAVIAGGVFVAAIALGVLFSPKRPMVESRVVVGETRTTLEPRDEQPIKVQQTPAERDRVATLNRAAAEILAPWPQWLSFLELQQDGVSIDSFSISQLTRTLQISGNATSHATLTRFTKRLGEYFGDEHLHLETLGAPSGPGLSAPFSIRIDL